MMNAVETTPVQGEDVVYVTFYIDLIYDDCPETVGVSTDREQAINMLLSNNHAVIVGGSKDNSLGINCYRNGVHVSSEWLPTPTNEQIKNALLAQSQNPECMSMSHYFSLYVRKYPCDEYEKNGGTYELNGVKYDKESIISAYKSLNPEVYDDVQVFSAHGGWKLLKDDQGYYLLLR